MITIRNDAGEQITIARGEAAAIAWWKENGRPGDYVDGTDTLISELAEACPADVVAILGVGVRSGARARGWFTICPQCGRGHGAKQVICRACRFDASAV